MASLSIVFPSDPLRTGIAIPIRLPIGSIYKWHRRRKESKRRARHPKTEQESSSTAAKECRGKDLDHTTPKSAKVPRRGKKGKGDKKSKRQHKKSHKTKPKARPPPSPP
ncbi:hypothetical protein KIPB_000601 [Kipferlia bialata]|uniref:Uncharacterized protein n=1 Tax=Kipferlia bialata TaxID=797122 RepID=A0A391NLC1_9EUKA|nr:hypothetical protein KIPB_000601 [Kipferlia bialata]|eukprot:g601.t1